jgi:hypothetical protein
VCVDGGCMPDQKPIFSCDKTGEVGTGAPGKCAVGSVCIKRSCYIACDPANADSCKSADKFNICKAVDGGGAMVNVCGSDTTLGTECGAGQACASPDAICVDGYCK